VPVLCVVSCLSVCVSVWVSVCVSVCVCSVCSCVCVGVLCLCVYVLCVAERRGLEFNTSRNAHLLIMRLIHIQCILAELQWHWARFNGSSIEFC
jgi:hypothetical protein